MARLFVAELVYFEKVDVVRCRLDREPDAFCLCVLEI